MLNKSCLQVKLLRDFWNSFEYFFTCNAKVQLRFLDPLLYISELIIFRFCQLCPAASSLYIMVIIEWNIPKYWHHQKDATRVVYLMFII